jgi:hypothetical protein
MLLFAGFFKNASFMTFSQKDTFYFFIKVATYFATKFTHFYLPPNVISYQVTLCRKPAKAIESSQTKVTNWHVHNQ